MMGSNPPENLAGAVEHVHGPEEVVYAEDELVVLCLLRDGRPYVKSFVEHYLRLGVKHLVFLDNGSTDGTVEVLRGYDRVTVLRTELPFKEYQFAMRRYLIERFGRDRWSLSVDIDEFFDYPYSDVVGLDRFLQRLGERSYTAVVAQMLEMFPEEPVRDTVETLTEDVSVQELHRFYDISEVRRDGWNFEVARGTGNVLANEEVESLWGGVKTALFGRKGTLTKHPLVFFDGRIKPVDGTAHRVSNATIADITCVLYHYKFLDDFYAQVRRAVRQENYMKDSIKQKQYLQILERTPSLELKKASARELRSVNDLVGSGFLVVSRDYMDSVAGEAVRNGGGWPRTARGLADAFFAARAEIRALNHENERLRRRVEDHQKYFTEKGLESNGALRNRTQRLEARVRDVEAQIMAVQSSRSWKLLSALSRVKESLRIIWSGKP